jgi:AraC-like DNA-binding protein
MRKEKNGGKISFFGDDRREVEFILSAMMREHTLDLPSSEAVIESYLGILFTKMMRQTVPAGDGAPTRDFWDELCEYIDKNLHEELTLSALAQKSFYNPSYFSRIFKQKYGISLSDYIRRRRIEHAMTLLVDSELSVDEIIARTGYTDRSAPDFTEGRSRATESQVGSWHGTVEYVIDHTTENGGVNICNEPFFEEGNGIHIVEKNIVFNDVLKE